ncbi:septum site-determining protein MinC [Limnohabitans sp.]|uniref:septum site-determining protein MinC n=1 Tax=Limnohabitans sp. TaxID=1907725 RepID=UPI00311DE32B
MTFATSPGFEIKSADLALVALLLKTANVEQIAQGLRAQFSDSPDFFDQDPLLIDLSWLSEADAGQDIDFSSLVRILREYGLMPLAIKGGSDAQRAAAFDAGLVDANDARIRRLSMETPLLQATETVATETAPAAPSFSGAVVLDRTLRSGQQFYAKGKDLVVLSMVNAGAEVIADGDIHIYSTLRGKAIAGARGKTDARIFAYAMEPELISIAGVYRTSENPLPKEVFGKPAQVSLSSGPDGDKLLITPLKA